MIVSCRNCAVEFDKKAAEIKRTGNHYCSKSCKGDFLSTEKVKRFYDACTANGECVEWGGAINKHGYGVVRYKKSIWLAHRASYDISFGDIGELLVCHACDNPACVNPNHLFLGTHQDNMDDMTSKGRRWSKLTFDNVNDIRSSSKSSRELSIFYGVSERTINHAKKAIHWQPLPTSPKGE